MRARYSILDFGLISAIFFTFLGVVLPHTRRMACSAYCPCLNRMLIGACNPMLFPIHVSKGIGHGLAVLAHSPTAHAHKRDSSLAVSFSNVSTLLGLCAATGKKGIAQCTNGVVHGYQNDTYTGLVLRAKSFKKKGVKRTASCTGKATTDIRSAYDHCHPPTVGIIEFLKTRCAGTRAGWSRRSAATLQRSRRSGSPNPRVTLRTSMPSTSRVQ